MGNHAIVHVEIPSRNAGKSAQFYREVFGWETHEHPELQYTTFVAEGGPGGGFAPVEGEMAMEPDKLLIHISTDDIEKSLAAVEKAGGKTVQGSMEIPGVGWFALFTDADGNRLGLFKGLPQG